MLNCIIQVIYILLIFLGLLNLLITERTVFKSLVVVDLSISLCNSVNICFIYAEDMSLSSD